MDFGFSGIDFRGIPRLMKGSLSVILLYNDDGTSHCYLLDNKAKLYTELFPNPSIKIQEAYCETKMNVKTMFKFYVDNTNLKIKKKNNSGFGFKKDVAFVIRKRDNEHIIGDYKSHIKTTITDLDKSRNSASSIKAEISKTLLNETEDKIKNLTNEYVKENENEIDENDSDSDIDDSDMESDDDNSESSTKDHQQPLLESNNDFRKMIDENIYSITDIDSEMSDKIIQMVLCGSDEKGNTIEKEDILYIKQLLPSFFTSYLNTNRLPEDQQKKLKEIYIEAVGKQEITVSDEGLGLKLKNSKNVYNMAHNIAENYYKSATSSSNDSKIFKNEPIKRERITEEEYFDPKNTESLHMGRVMEISEEKKLIKNALKFYLTKEDTFPLNCYHIKPIIDIICLILFDQINIKKDDKDYDREIYYNTVNYIFNEVNAAKRFLLKFGKFF
ncbi:hypothetical protein PIROE2DRAFT_58875 [Piromyces sp. E2]|nr:hypothetical protein PIROE2DRAFT_58875 [Piromyces sp. E2]|eukprot:OUM67252.1 hypothetical protein PIROE2DRAFT_58875 [Piromyces sp. E2]